MHINGIAIVGLIDTDADLIIITPQSWNPNWSLQEAGVQFLAIETPSHVKQSNKYVE